MSLSRRRLLSYCALTCVVISVAVVSALVYVQPGYAILGIGQAGGSFESFYTTKGLSWIDWAIAGLSTLGLGVVVFFTGGLASPLLVLAPGVKVIATWIGGLGTKLAGTAALNHGLALLGGGTIAAGGLGKAGGAAVLSTVLAGAWEAPFWTAGEVYDALVVTEDRDYDYNGLLQQRRNFLATLPLPKNHSGPKAYEAGIDVLEEIEDLKDLSRDDALLIVQENHRVLVEAIHAIRWNLNSESEFRKRLEMIDDTLELSSPLNQEIINTAVGHLLYDTWAVEDLADASLLSLLYFILNDYERAKQYSSRAEIIARYEAGSASDIDEGANLAIFVGAVSSLYDEDFDWKEVLDRVERSVLSDPENVLIPLLLAILLDRVELRINDGYLDEQAFAQILEIMEQPEMEEFRFKNFVILLSRYLKRLEVERQTIEVLVRTENDTIRSNLKTLETVEESLRAYKALLDEGSYVEKWITVLPLEEEEDRRNVVNVSSAFSRYSFKTQELVDLVVGLRAYQAKG